MCPSLWQFFIAVRDFKRSVREVKTNLSDIKSILNGTLAMTQELEEVSLEFKNITEFYSQESKNALRDQLCTTMSTNAHEAFYHRDFIKHFKLTFEFEINMLIEDYNRKIGQLAVLDIIQHLKRVVKDWMNKYSDDKLKVRLLVELTLYLQESFSQYICDDDDIWANTEKKRRRSNIKTFCEKQYVIQTMEDLLYEHLSKKHITEADCFSNSYSNVHDIVYRQRATRIRRFRQFLTSKIKIKKIGKYYREEISLQVNVDLKRAANEIWHHESVLRKQCAEIVHGLKVLPRHRFVDVLAEENVMNLGQKLANLTFKSFLPSESAQATTGLAEMLPQSKELFHEHLTETKEFFVKTFSRKNDSSCETLELFGGKSPETRESFGEEIHLLVSMLETIPEVLCDNIRDKNTTINESSHETSSTGCISESKNLTVHKETTKTIPNESGTITGIGTCWNEGEGLHFMDFLKEEFLHMFDKTNIRKLFSKEMFVYSIQRHQQILKFNETLGELTFPDLHTQTAEIHPTQKSNQLEISDDRIIIDPQLIFDDIEQIMRKALQYIGRKSARYTIQLVDRSHVMSSKIIDFLSNIHALYQYDLTEEKCENIFIEKIIEIIAIDLKDKEINILKNIVFAFTNNKKNKLAFLKKLERSLPATVLRTLDTGKDLIQKTNIDNDHTAT